jgi:hypothetical protein
MKATGQLAFLADDRFFDGRCIRFTGVDGDREVKCGVTIAALKECDRTVQRHGLVPAEVFLASYDKLMISIHDAARAKYSRSEFETEGPVKIMVDRGDLAPEA